MIAAQPRLCLAVAALLLTGASAWAQDSVEYALKAAYLTKFAPFVQWPQDPVGAIALCVVGGDPFGVTLDKALGGVGRAIVVKRIPVLTPNDACHIAFADGPAAAQALSAVRGLPVLTVTQNAADDAARGIVNFVLVDRRVRFEIDRAAAAQSRLVVSSKLLNLAVAR